MRFSIIGALPMQSPTSNDRSRTGAVAAIDGGSCLQNVGASSTELRFYSEGRSRTSVGTLTTLGNISNRFNPTQASTTASIPLHQLIPVILSLMVFFK